MLFKVFMAVLLSSCGPQGVDAASTGRQVLPNEPSQEKLLSQKSSGLPERAYEAIKDDLQGSVSTKNAIIMAVTAAIGTIRVQEDRDEAIIRAVSDNQGSTQLANNIN